MATASSSLSISLSLMEEELTCSICFNLLRDPKELDCLHVFCLQCLQRWVKKEPTIECPECRHVTIVPQGGLANLKTILRLKAMVKKYEEHIDEQKEGTPFCPNHEGERQHFFCIRCGVTVCRDCLVLEHERPQHEIKELKVITKEQKGTLKTKMEHVQKEVQKAESDEKRLDEMERKLQAAKEKTKKDIKKRTEVIVAEAKAQERKKIEHVDTFCQEQMIVLSEGQRRTKDRVAHLKSVYSAAQSAVSTASDHIFMKNHGSQLLVSKMEKLCSVQRHELPSSEVVLEFKPGSDEVDDSLFGKVIGHGNWKTSDECTLTSAPDVTVGNEGTENQEKEEPMEDGDSRLEATFSYTVQNIRKLKETSLSPAIKVRNLPWKIRAMPKGSNGRGRKKTPKSLGFFLWCNADSDSQAWSCQASAELRLRNQKDGPNLVKRIQHLFNCKENDWGFSHFISWNDLLDPQKGYVKNGSITLEVKIVADASLGVRRLEAQRQKEKTEGHMTMQVLSEDQFYGHHGNDLCDFDKFKFREFQILKSATFKEVMGILSQAMGYREDQLRLWPFSQRTNQTYRPTVLELDEPGNSILEVSEGDSPWTVFLETPHPECPDSVLLPFDKETDVLLFLKMYDPKAKIVSYCGHAYAPISTKISQLIPLMCERAGYPPNTRLAIYEEVKPNMTEKIPDQSLDLEKALDELMDGDILVFQRDDPGNSRSDLPTARDYFRDLCYRVEVTFCDKDKPSDTGFALKLSQKLNYYGVAKAVADYLETDPMLLQFFKSQGRRDGPGHPLSTYEDSLRDLLVTLKPRQPKKLYYERLGIKITELQYKRIFKCVWVIPKLKQEDLVLYPNKTDTVRDLLREAHKQVQLSENGTGKLRLMDVISNKIFQEHKEDTKLVQLSNNRSTTYRIEEVPLDHVSLGEDEMLVSIVHFEKELFCTFGTPFLLRIKHGEAFTNVKERVRDQLDISEEEMEMIKFAIVVMGMRSSIPDDKEYRVDLKDFQPQTHSGGIQQPRPWLGLDHVNKNKRPR
ncbi:ubiquitin carboxyl-terminal hydrolase 7-like [Amphiura filiformis]|uniref:ubiquitin carboxyl-terminal hydrolase 7-like n=1 Tax=Amphiura filiformis TaxID=82378 RepID=UPI003B20DF6E